MWVISPDHKWTNTIFSIFSFLIFAICQTLCWSLLIMVKSFMFFALRFLGNIDYRFLNYFLVLYLYVCVGRLYETMNMIIQWKWNHLTCISWLQILMYLHAYYIVWKFRVTINHILQMRTFKIQRSFIQIFPFEL